MQGLIRCALLAGTLLGCGPGGVQMTGDDVMPTSDAPPGAHGLIIEWSSAPAIPSSGSPSVEEARFALNSLRVVGDAGDIRRGMTDMRFNWSGSEPTPMAMTFADAPTGLYSEIALAFDGGSSNDSYEIRGQVDVTGSNYEYRIEDADPISFNVPIAVMVTPGKMTVVKLRINFMLAVDSVDWSSVDVSDGRKEIDENSDEIPAFRTTLIQSFQVESQL